MKHMLSYRQDGENGETMYYVYHGSSYINAYRTYSEAWAKVEELRRLNGWVCTIEYAR